MHIKNKKKVWILRVTQESKFEILYWVLFVFGLLLLLFLIGLFDREVIDEYGRELVKLCGRLMKVLSINLGLEEDYLQNAFGGENIGACLRVNFYPKCPQPDLTLGLSSHSDPGGMTLLLPDQHVYGLQVRKDNKWITVKPAPHAFIVNIGDQIQVIFFF